PHGIGVAPFEPVTLFGDKVEFLGEQAFFAPCVAGYVGGDITCGLLAIDVRSEDEPVLFLDLGTNGEMALGDRSGIVTCATAAGPVFEGSNVRFGMPAYPGAISSVRLVDGSLELEVIGGEEPVGICGTGLIDAVAVLLELGIVDETGRMLDDDEAADEVDDEDLAGRVFELDGRPAFRLAGEIAITQEDIRNLQLAKAAVMGGIETLMERRGIDAFDVAKLQIAGGFGQYLDLRNAARIGLFPEELLDKASSVGNTSIEGASAALFSSAAREELARIVEVCDYVELSGDAAFNAHYIDAMMFE
ncbi:MAG: ASKHA domain-containing protein, partial [Coriobacteriaceae bacterium]|nr:ASKHA domain-containing protein [Coriobacteriaceae bacterium]